jgi:adenylyltransferase/sulfurtransferase
VKNVSGIAAPLAIDPKTVSLSAQEINRYSRHLIMPEVTIEGQKRLKAASVLCIGTGGLGSPLTLYLAAAGVGRIGLVDFDVVDVTNLQRQIVHGTKDVGRPKIESAKETLADINPEIIIETHETLLSSENALELFKDYDIIIDGTDNFPTRYLVNDACVLLGKPNVYGSIFRFEGQATVFWADQGPCYRCLYPEPPPPGLVPSCAEGGVLGILPGTVGCIQATEAVKLILGIGEPLIGRLMLFDALGMRFKELKLRKDPDCPICGANPTVTGLIDYEEFCGIGRGMEEAPAPVIDTMREITPLELKAKMDRGDKFTLVDVREPYEWDIANLPGAKLIPLGTVAARADELDPDTEIVLQCRSGKRSAEALGILKEKGFKNLVNLKGGILAWADDVDPTVPKY